MGVELAAPLELSQSRSLFEAVGFQPLAVSGHINDRCLVTFRAPAKALQQLLEAAAGTRLAVDVLNGEGFVSVCAVDLAGMHIQGLPRALAFDNREMLYRLAVRLPSGEPSFVTLRSDVSARALAVLGGVFSHYRPRRAQLECRKTNDRWTLACRSRDGLADAELEADLASLSERSAGSRFPDAAAASDFLLGMACSVAARGERLQVQPIDHSNWQPKFVALRRCRFAYLDELGRHLGAAFEYDSTLYVGDVDQVWRAARRLRSP